MKIYIGKVPGFLNLWKVKLKELPENTVSRVTLVCESMSGGKQVLGTAEEIQLKVQEKQKRSQRLKGSRCINNCIMQRKMKFSINPLVSGVQ